MQYYIYNKGEELFGRACSPRPLRENYPKMEIENFEDVEMEWHQKFDQLPEIKCHPDPRLKPYFIEQMAWGQFIKGTECEVVEICQGVTNWYPVQCGVCGWVGSSEELNGGGQIADTGDYGDAYCPQCEGVCGEWELEDNIFLIPEQKVINGIIKQAICGLSRLIAQSDADERSVATGAT